MSDINKDTHNQDEHIYDEIRELDNPMPGWLAALFYLCIIFAAGYFGYYVLGPGPSQVKTVEDFISQQELKALVKSAAKKEFTDAELAAVLKDSKRVTQGKEIFLSKCVSCHGKLGEGGIGPNLTDDYWIHGNKLTEIAKVVSDGVAPKGMPNWGAVLSRDEVASVTAFVKSLRGTRPPNAKAPEGTLMKE